MTNVPTWSLNTPEVFFFFFAVKSMPVLRVCVCPCDQCKSAIQSSFRFWFELYNFQDRYILSGLSDAGQQVYEIIFC